MERLQKYLARAGVAARRDAEQLILAGRVKVNGKVVKELGFKVSDRDVVEVDGRIVKPEKLVYILMYKPAGYITTVDDPFGRPTVLSLLAGKVKERVFPVGRLDMNTEGLLILTNDGDLAMALTHPKHRVPKTYLALVRGTPNRAKLKELEQGVLLEDGYTAPAKVNFKKPEGKNSWIEITIHEGRKRQVRRMFKKIGHPVLKLIRTRIGFLTGYGLKKGSFRYLTPAEVLKLKRLANSNRG
ncbi:RNA pseudouridine synthase [Carboxydothermus islandicus]|uniref:Pseudouridine synthase n=1 Tax=Carboxydothermus islandicus TaxID=661089 RepID=A0A1L8D0E6_9THEO|nr:pseudouridine synthase [Carboxydothermus islandicus]GAV24632.1 RNA pseudouridine synthase [Carboxydothermus islandicus]